MKNSSHEFHKNCIDPWLIEHRTCPMCKLDVLKFYGYIIGDLTIEHVGTPTPVQFVHLEIPTDSPQLQVRSSSGIQPSTYFRSSSSSNSRDRNSGGNSTNCSTHNITNIIIDNSNSDNTASHSHQVTEV